MAYVLTSYAHSLSKFKFLQGLENNADVCKFYLFTKKNAKTRHLVPQGNKVIFTKRVDSMNNGDAETLESYHPNTLTLKSANSFVFDEVTLTRQK